jgi:hypothetical protein
MPIARYLMINHLYTTFGGVCVASTPTVGRAINYMQLHAPATERLIQGIKNRPSPKLQLPSAQTGIRLYTKNLFFMLRRAC